jgi:hypothetical protein
VVEDWQQTFLQHLVNGATFDNLKRVLLDAMVLFGGLCK